MKRQESQTRTGGGWWSPAVGRWSFVVGPLLAFTALGLLLTWPLGGHFATHVPGDGIDDPSLAWNLWWAKHALVDLPQNPFAVDWQFWPVGINLAFYTLTLLNGALSVPLQALIGVISSYNVLLLSSFVLSGFGAYLLCLDFLGRTERRRAGEGERGRAGEWERGRGGERGSERAPCHPVTLSPCHPVTLSAFIGGAFYAFASAKMFYAALGQGNIASSQWIPFAALYFVRAIRPQGRLRDAVLAALFLVLQAYAELTFASFLLIFAGLAAVWGVWQTAGRGQGTGVRGRGPVVSGQWSVVSGHPASVIGRRSSVVGRQPSVGGRWSFLVRLALVGALSACGIAPILSNMLPDLEAEGDFFTSGGGFADLFSADLVGYTLPTQLHPLLGDVIRRVANNSAPRPDGSHFPVNKGQHIYLGYVALALVFLGLVRNRRRGAWFWAGCAVFFFVLTLGPSLRVAGHDLHIPLPFDLIAQLPFFKGNRYPSRYAVMLLMSVSVLMAAGVRQIVVQEATAETQRTQRIPTSDLCVLRASAVRFSVRGSAAWRLVLVGIVLTLLLFEHLSAPMPLSDLRVPTLYDQVARVPGDFALLELPPGWRNGARVAGKQDIVIMQQLWNQTAHGKRVLGGNTSRNPEFKFQFFSEDPTLARLIATTNAADVPQHEALRAALAADPISAAEAARARDWAATWGIRYVMVHRDKLPAATEEAVRQLLPLSLVGEEGSLALYALVGDLRPPVRFPVATDAGRMVLAEGWSPPGLGEAVLAQRTEARLLLPLGPEARRLRLDVQALAPDQRVTLIVDGRSVRTQPVPQARGWLTFDLPQGTELPLSDVRLGFAALVPAGQPATAAALQPTPGSLPLPVVVRSAGQETGDFAHVYVGGTDLSPNGRGYNLVALDPADGHLLRAAAFDTHADPTAGRRLAEWVASLPMGTIVAGAVRDEGTMNLSAEAVDALRKLGSAADLRAHFRWGHAFVGVMGAPPGSASEQVNGTRVAQVALGLPATAPQVAAALFAVEIVK